MKDVELSTVKSSMRELQREVAEKTRLLHKAEKDATDMKNRFRSELLFLERRLGDENKELRCVLLVDCVGLLHSFDILNTT